MTANSTVANGEGAAPASLTRFVAEPPPRAVTDALERLRHLGDVARIAVMPDVHLAEGVCVGTVVATRTLLLPAAVGGDIGCGMAAVACDVEASALDDAHTAAAVLVGLQRAIPALRHPGGQHPLPPALAGRPLSAPSLRSEQRRTAGLQLGTLGRGNHFLELQADEDDRLWLMVHSGSRGMGTAIRDHHDALASPVGAGLRGLVAASPEGAAYLGDMQWALDYAEANRAALAARAAEVLGTCLKAHVLMDTWISCHHNFVRREPLGDESLWVHRKGAVSARADEPGIVPGSMGAPSYHTCGRGEVAGLCSSAHGAGRAMSRGEARRHIRAGDVVAQMRGVWFDHRAADALRDEAPAAYKDIGAVMRAQRALTRVVRRLRPLLSFKAA
ncbi:RtcB family protein [Nannocystis bainbridge]|uniref:3'-phosphate/5'-hydroxy nucleic acid ligase n=1 Tax=Nannocystis bainbridge TaxID=2995303 RepID=A0ABT5DW64_9BACT|nr:RtcB family protein [Nannocystis bainbridge]MDC0717882.1 RtcB family protein [Nannocystis bainbridge]